MTSVLSVFFFGGGEGGSSSRAPLLEMTASGRRLEDEDGEVEGGRQLCGPWVMLSRELGAKEGGGRASVWGGELRISNAPVEARADSRGRLELDVNASGGARSPGHGGGGVAMFLRVSLPAAEGEGEVGAAVAAARSNATGAASRHPLLLCADNYITLLPGSMPSRRALPFALVLFCLLSSLLCPPHRPLFRFIFFVCDTIMDALC